MLKKCFFIIITLFLIIYLFANTSYGIFTPNVYQSDDKKIMAFAELNAATIELPNGSRIHSTNINGDTQMNITTITTPVELILVVDTSGSMSGNSISSTKSAIHSLVETFFTQATSAKIDLYTFASDAAHIISSDNKDEILGYVNSLSASGGTNMLPALELAEEKLNEIANYEEEVKPYLIILTDGETERENECYNKLMEIFNRPTPIYNILVGMSTNSAFSRDGVDAGFIYANISSQEIQDIYDGIYEDICYDLINNDVSDFIENAKNYFIANDDLYMFLDRELVQGCKLELEYLINIKCAMPVTHILLQSNVDSKLSFDPSSKMISEDTTNEDYGWKVNTNLSNTNDHNLVLTLDEQSNAGEEPLIKAKKTYQSKLLFSCLLSNKEDTNYTNELAFRLNDAPNLTATLESMEVNIVPPFGANHSYLPIIILIIILVLIFIILLIIKLKHKNHTS